MIDMNNAAVVVEVLGVDGIAHLQGGIMSALASGDDAEAWRLDDLLGQVEAVLKVDAYPDMMRSGTPVVFLSIAQ